MARKVRSDELTLITEKAAASRVRRAVAKALTDERLEKPYAFTGAEIAIQEQSFREEGFNEGQAVLRKGHVVLTHDELTSKLDEARGEAAAQVKRNFPYMFTPDELEANDDEVRYAFEKELRIAFDAGLAEKCAEAKAAGSKEAVEAIRRAIANAFSGCNFEMNPAFLSGLGMLAGKFLKQACKSQPGTPEAEFGFVFANQVFEAME